MDMPLEFLVCCAFPVALVLLGAGSRERGTPSHPEPGEGGGPPWQGEAQHVDSRAGRGQCPQRAVAHGQRVEQPESGERRDGYEDPGTR